MALCATLHRDLPRQISRAYKDMGKDRRMNGIELSSHPPHAARPALPPACHWLVTGVSLAALPNWPLFRSRRRAARAAADASARPLPWGPGRCARAHRQGATDQPGSPGHASGAGRIRRPRSGLSSSQPLRLGRSLRSRRMRSVSPNLDPVGHSHGSWRLRGQRSTLGPHQARLAVAVVRRFAATQPAG
jgi:hypothetical protein